MIDKSTKPNSETLEEAISRAKDSYPATSKGIAEWKRETELSINAACDRMRKKPTQNPWKPIAGAKRIAGVEIIGTRWGVGEGKMVCIQEPFVSFWSPTMNVFFAGPTHYIEMPAQPLPEGPSK